MTGPPSRRPLLLIESAGWLVGIDSFCVREIGSAVGVAPACAESLAALLQERQIEGRPEPTRSVIVGTDERQHVVLVERIIGQRVFPLEEMQALPGVLRNFGAPSWLLGTTWHEDRLVLLLDLSAAYEPSDGIPVQS